MWPYLLLALALLGTVPPSCSDECPYTPTCPRRHPGDKSDPRMTLTVPLGPASPVAGEIEEVVGLAVPEEDVGASDTQTLSVPSMPGTRTPTYIMVSHCRTFQQAQRYCACRYHGRLASIHSASINSFLLRMVHRLSNAALVWIGAVSQPAFPRPRCHWTDQSPWDYSQWVPGHPLPGHRFCTSLCSNNGLWMSVNCRRQLPFICEI